MTMLRLSHRAFCLVLGLGALAGCAVSDEGATEFRSTGTGDASTLRQNVLQDAVGRPIRPGEPLLVTLETAYIKDFTEYFSNPLRGSEGANGEIAIVANVFEDDGTTTLDFGPAGLKAARVVFFSDDVDKGQFLNFHGLPLYGPLTYKGYPVVIDLYAVDLDRPGPQLRQMLENLAKIGSVAYPPGTPIAGALAQLAGTLIADDQDDKAYHHTLVQRPAGGADGIPYSVLQAGHIVFIRSNQRSNGIDWSQIALNPSAGVLVKHGAAAEAAGGEAGCMVDNPPTACLYRDNTYMVVEVNTAPSALVQDRQKIIFSALRDEFAGTGPPIATGPVPAEAIDTLKTQVALAARADRANHALGKVEAQKALPAERNAAAVGFVTAWFESKTPLPQGSEQGLIERATAKIAQCGATTPDLVEMTEALQSHKADAATRNAIAQNLSCAARRTT